MSDVVENKEDYDPQNSATVPLAGDAAAEHQRQVLGSQVFGDGAILPVAPVEDERVAEPVEEPTAAEQVDEIRSADTVEEVEEIAEGDDRKTVQKAAEVKKDQLKK